MIYECEIKTDQGDFVAFFTGEGSDTSPIGGTYASPDLAGWQASNDEYGCMNLVMTCNTLSDCSGNINFSETVESCLFTVVCGFKLMCGADCVRITGC